MRDSRLYDLLRRLHILVHALDILLGGRHIQNTAMDGVAATVVVATRMLTIGGRA